MSAGFKDDKTGKNVKVSIDMDAVAQLTKKYKKIKKYMKSPIYDLKQMAGTEKVVSELLKELDENS